MQKVKKVRFLELEKKKGRFQVSLMMIPIRAAANDSASVVITRFEARKKVER